MRPNVKTPNAYCLLLDSVLQIVEDLGIVTELKTAPSDDDFSVNSRPFSIPSNFLMSHHCLCHACCLIKQKFEIILTKTQKEDTYPPWREAPPSFRRYFHVKITGNYITTRHFINPYVFSYRFSISLNSILTPPTFLMDMPSGSQSEERIVIRATSDDPSSQRLCSVGSLYTGKNALQF